MSKPPSPVLERWRGVERGREEKNGNEEERKEKKSIHRCGEPISVPFGESRQTEGLSLGEVHFTLTESSGSDKTVCLSVSVLVCVVGWRIFLNLLLDLCRF